MDPAGVIAWDGLSDPAEVAAETETAEQQWQPVVAYIGFVSVLDHSALGWPACPATAASCCTQKVVVRQLHKRESMSQIWQH